MKTPPAHPCMYCKKKTTRISMCTDCRIALDAERYSERVQRQLSGVLDLLAERLGIKI